MKPKEKKPKKKHMHAHTDTYTYKHIIKHSMYNNLFFSHKKHTRMRMYQTGSDFYIEINAAKNTGKIPLNNSSSFFIMMIIWTKYRSTY